MTRKKNDTASVVIVMGSDSDKDIMSEAARTLKDFGIGYEITVSSAHRSPDRTRKLVKQKTRDGIRLFIVGAGRAAHLAGVIAAETHLPVIGVPVESPPFDGLDSLLSTVQMPAGIPVATMATGKAGARNAALFALQILALNDKNLEKKLKSYKIKLAEGVAEKARVMEKLSWYPGKK